MRILPHIFHNHENAIDKLTDKTTNTAINTATAFRFFMCNFLRTLIQDYCNCSRSFPLSYSIYRKKYLSRSTFGAERTPKNQIKVSMQKKCFSRYFFHEKSGPESKLILYRYFATIFHAASSASSRSHLDFTGISHEIKKPLKFPSEVSF